MEVLGPADAREAARGLKPRRHRDRVHRIPRVVQGDGHVEDRLVRRPIEVGGAHHLHHVGHGVLGEHHGAEDGLLGLEVLRRRSVEAPDRRLQLLD